MIKGFKEFLLKNNVLALAIAVIFDSFVSLAMSRNFRGFSVQTPGLRQAAISAPLALSLFVLAGFRYLFRLPVELRANWVFRVNEPGNRLMFLSAVERFLICCAVAPVAIVTLPVGILMSFLAMRMLGLSANIMSLGGFAIAIGAMIDAAIVMVENLHKHFERAQSHVRMLTPGERWNIVLVSAREVGPSLFVSLLIITLSFIPVFALEAQGGRLFHPLAWTKTLALVFSSLLSITLVPALMPFCLRGKLRPERSNPAARITQAMYLPVLRWCLRHFGAFTLFGVLWAGLCIVPGVVLLILPMGVAGATRMLATVAFRESWYRCTSARHGSKNWADSSGSVVRIPVR